MRTVVKLRNHLPTSVGNLPKAAISNHLDLCVCALVVDKVLGSERGASPEVESGSSRPTHP